MAPKPDSTTVFRFVALCFCFFFFSVSSHRPRTGKLSLAIDSAGHGQHIGTRKKLRFGRSGSTIVGGVDASIEQMPFAVAVGVFARGFRTVCAGSLVSPGVVLTAAHCVYDAEIRDGRPNALVRNGLWIMYNASNPNDPEVVADAAHVEKAQHSEGSRFFASVRQVRNPRGFDMGSVTLTGWQNQYFDLDDDIALLVLEKCLSGLKPVRLATTGDNYDRECVHATVLGWEHTETVVGAELASRERVKQGPNHLQRSHPMTMHNSSVCKKLMALMLQNMAEMVPSDLAAEHEGFREVWQSMADESEFAEILGGNYSRFSGDRLICLAGNNMTGLCHGDSGGPVVVQDEHGYFVQVGILNVFPKAACGTHPDFAQRVSFYSQWIDNVLSNENICSSANSPYDHSMSFTQAPMPHFPVDMDDAATHCAVGEWQCAEDGRCIPDTGRCNGTMECTRGSDELNVCGKDVLDICGNVTVSKANEMMACRAEISTLLAEVANRTATASFDASDLKHPQVVAACEVWAVCSLRYDFQTKGKRGVLDNIQAEPCGRFLNKDREVVIDQSTTNTLGTLIEIQKACKDEIHRRRLWDGDHSRRDRIVQGSTQCTGGSPRDVVEEEHLKAGEIVKLSKELPPTDGRCIASTTVGKQCLFPFIYADQTYTTCTRVHNFWVFWCPTSLDSERHYNYAWGNCAVQHPCEHSVAHSQEKAHSVTIILPQEPPKKHELGTGADAGGPIGEPEADTQDTRRPDWRAEPGADKPEVQPEVQLPDAFGFDNTGVFAVTDESEFGPQSHKHEAAILKGSEFAEKHPHLESTFEKIKTYAFSYPSQEHENGAWLYHGEDENGKGGNLLASRPIGALVNKQPADEWFVKEWSGKVLVDTEGEPLVDADGKNKICEMKSEGWFVDQYQDVAEYCWAPNCLMLENNGAQNGGCLVFKMRSSTVGWTAYVWSLQKSTVQEAPSEAPSGDEQEAREEELSAVLVARELAGDSAPWRKFRLLAGFFVRDHSDDTEVFWDTVRAIGKCDGNVTKAQELVEPVGTELPDSKEALTARVHAGASKEWQDFRMLADQFAKKHSTHQADLWRAVRPIGAREEEELSAVLVARDHLDMRPLERIYASQVADSSTTEEPSESTVAAAVLAASVRPTKSIPVAEDPIATPIVLAATVRPTTSSPTTEDPITKPMESDCIAFTMTGDNCVFPFVYNDVWYHQCTQVAHHAHDDDGMYWCATSVGRDNEYTGSWGKCADQQPCASEVPETFLAADLTDSSNSTRSLANERTGVRNSFLIVSICIYLSFAS